MKFFLFGLFALTTISMSVFADEVKLEKIDAPSENVIATIKNRNRMTPAEIKFSREQNILIFKLVEQGIETEIKRLTVNLSADEVEISGNNRAYFPILKYGSRMTGGSYAYLFSEQKDGFNKGMIPALDAGMFIFLPLTLTLPAIPAIISIVLSPVDGAISAFGLLHKDNIAKRKFAKLVNGKSATVSNEVFNSLLSQISKL